MLRPLLRVSAAIVALAPLVASCQGRNLESRAMAQGVISDNATDDTTVPPVGHYKQLRDDTYLVVLQPGAKLLKSLTTFQALTGIKTAALTGIGVVKDTTLGFYKFNADGTPAKTHTDDTIAGAREVTSLICNFMTRIVTEGQADQAAPPHCHIALAGRDDQTPNGAGWNVVGGHLIEATVGVTAELIVTTYPTEVNKRPSDAFGGFLIDATPAQGGTAFSN